MMLKKFRCLVLVMVLILVVVSGTTFAAKKPLKLIFGTVFVPGHFFVNGDLKFKELVEKNSKGQILIDYYPASQLGSESEQMQATRSGAQQIYGGAGLSSFVAYWPKIGTFALPYLFRDQAHQIKVSKKITSIVDQDEFVAKTGVRILNVRIRAPRHLTTKTPVNKLEDIKGLKIRVPESKIFLATWAAFGAIPTVIPAADTYTALATGTVDAQENPLVSTYTLKFHEQQKYCALTAHFFDFTVMTINDKCWKNLTNRQRKILTDAAVVNAEMGNKDSQESEKKYYNLLVKEGIKFTKPDLTPFRERAKTVWSQYGDQELIDKIQAVK
jgi:tripartite ATP-independent transporter DctP family solute receptor